MFGSSAIRVISQTPSTLEVLEPGNTLGYALIAAGALWLLIALFLFSTPRPKPLMAIILFGGPLALIAAGLASATWETRTTFSRGSNRVTVTGRVLWLPLQRTEVPLSRVRSAEVVTIHVTRNILLHLDSGSVIRIGNNSDRPGHYEVAHAINEFLNRRANSL